MTMTDPIADMLTRVRNAIQAGHEKVDIPASRLKTDIARILEREGYIKSHRIIEDNQQGIIRIYLAPEEKGKVRPIQGLKRISKPSRRVYVPKEKVPTVLNGMGVAVLSTSKGVLTDRESRESGVGGEVLFHVW